MAPHFRLPSRDNLAILTSSCLGRAATSVSVVARLAQLEEETRMIWIKPEFKDVAVTLEVTAYAGRK
jgi:coenzyme PQQ precursor peptide PqqA